MEQGAYRGLDEAAVLALLAAEGLTEGHGYDDAPGARYESHVHAFDKVLVCQRGGVVFTTTDGDLRLGPGDRLDLDRETPHSAAIDDDGVRLVEAHRT